MNKVIKYILLAITLFFTGNNIVYANTSDHIVDFSKKGTFEVVLKDFDETNKIEGAEIALYHVATVTSKNNKYLYRFI